MLCSSAYRRTKPSHAGCAALRRIVVRLGFEKGFLFALWVNTRQLQRPLTASGSLVELIPDNPFCVKRIQISLESIVNAELTTSTANLVGVVPLRLVFYVKHERVRYEELQAWPVAPGDGRGRGRRGTRWNTAHSACSPPHWWDGQKLCREQGQGSEEANEG